MPTYTGPVPPAPTPDTPANDPKWTNWWAYQTVETNARYEDERETARVLASARVLVEDEQHAARLTAQSKCAEATQAGAVATTELAAAQKAYANVLAARTEPEVTAVAAGLQALATAIKGVIIPPPAPVPTPAPSPEPATGLLADAFAVVRRLVASYKAPSP